MKMVFVAIMISNTLCIIYAFFDYFFQKSFFTENYFQIAGPFYTLPCLVSYIQGTVTYWYIICLFMCS